MHAFSQIGSQGLLSKLKKVCKVKEQKWEKQVSFLTDTVDNWLFLFLHDKYNNKRC